jgi:uncharacterized protein (TIGR02145 family)
MARNNEKSAHYSVGNHYQWNTVTAGTGGALTNGQAPSSICPRGWKLPESNTTVPGSFGNLLNSSSIGSDVTKLTSTPNYFVRGGTVVQDANYLFDTAGNYGYYWSSTPSSNSGLAYRLGFGGTNVISPSTTANRYYGFSVRCIAR